MLEFRRSRQALKRDRRQGMRESRQAQTQVGNVYDQLGPSLDAINSQYQTQTAGIPGQLTEQIGSLSSMLGSNIGAVPDAERAAGTNLIGTLGAGTLEQLASDQSRNAAYGASASRQGEIQRLTDQRNILGERRDFQEDIRNRRQDLMSGTDQMIRQRQDELARQAFDRRMALQAMAISQGTYGYQSAQAAADITMTELEQRALAELLGNPQALAALFGLS